MNSSEPLYGVLNVDDIIVDKGFNCFAPLDEDSLFELGESLSEDGQLMPIVVNQTGDEEYHLIAGEQRLTALRAEGIETVECKILQDVDAVKAVRLHAIENIRRRKPRPMDEARVMKRLADLGQNTQQIAGVMKCSKDTVLTRMKLLDLTEEVQRMVDRTNNPLPIHQAMLVARVPADRQLAVAVKIAPASGAIMGESEARDLVDEELNGPRPITAPPAKKQGAPRVQSNVRHDPDKDADGGFEEITDDGWPAINEDPDNYSDVNDKDEYTEFMTYKVPLPKIKALAAEALYALDADDTWHAGFLVSTPSTGFDKTLPNAFADGFKTATEAVADGLERCQVLLEKACEQATSATLKKELRSAIEKIGKRINFLTHGDERGGAQESSTAAPEKPKLPQGVTPDLEPVAGTVGIAGKLAIGDGGLVVTGAMVTVKIGDDVHLVKVAAIALELCGDKDIQAVFELLKKHQPKPAEKNPAKKKIAGKK